MGDSFKTIKVAAVHAASVFLDRDACVEKACGYIKQCAAAGARLIVFPETYIPGYPFWIWTHTTLAGSDFFQKMYANSVTLDGDAVRQLGASARAAGAFVVIGVTERERSSLYNSLLYFDDQGKLIGRHRKLQLTNIERVVWSRGDAGGLQVHDTAIGRVGGLVCGEHSLDLIRHALTAQYEEIHIAVWPALSAISYHPRAGLFNEVSEVAARYHAFAGQTFVISVQSCIDDDTIAALGFSERPEMIRRGGGHTVIVGPDGCLIAGPHNDQEGVLYADLDFSRIARIKQVYDSVGHYSRPDVARLYVRRDTDNAPAVFDRTEPNGVAPAIADRAGELAGPDLPPGPRGDFDNSLARRAEILEPPRRDTV